MKVLASNLAMQEVTLRSKRWNPMLGAVRRVNTKDSIKKCLTRASLEVQWLRLYATNADASGFDPWSGN